MPVFDPNQALPDFEAQNTTAARQRAIADALRKQAMSQAAPQGQMIGPHYVAPSWTQYLAPMLEKYQMGAAERTAQASEQDALNAQNQAANQWRSSLPQATAAVPQQTAPFMAPGMDGEENIPGTSTITQQAAPAVPVSTGARLKATLAGLANPKTAKEATVWNAGMAEEATREDNQLARKENLVAQLAAKAEDAKRRSEDLSLSVQQRTDAAKIAAEARIEAAKIAADARRDAAALAASVRGAAGSDRAARAEERSQDKVDRQLEHISEKSKTLAPMLQAGQVVQDMLDEHGDKSVPGLGYSGLLPGVMLSKQGNVNRAKVKAFANAMLRNQAGLSQTLSETENANLEMLANGKFTEAEFKAIWPTLREKVGASAQTVTAGFLPEVVETFKKRGGRITPITPKARAAAWKVEEVK